jgi:hypothetical protein
MGAKISASAQTNSRVHAETDQVFIFLLLLILWWIRGPGAHISIGFVLVVAKLSYLGL